MRKRLSSSVAPPPSPIPTGRGSRSAVDSILGEYIDQSIHVPHLTLPKNTHRWVPDEIHYPSLLLRENDAMNRLLSSAAEFGVVRIIGHGISGEELRTMLTENEWLFRLSREKYANYDKFVWDWSDNTMVQKAKVAIGEQNFLFFRQQLEEVLKKLKGIAKEVDEIIRLSNSDESWKKIEAEEVKMYIYRCTKNQSSSMDQTWLPPHNATLEDSFKYALNLYLPLEPLEFSVHSKRGRLPFITSPDTIIVTIGHQLEEWSDGKFRSADGEVALKPNLHIDQALLSLELKWSFTNLNDDVYKTEKRITLSDQVLILVILILVYRMFLFMCTNN
ncbi:PREDICTED: uncharacterized protein LOC109223060 [Nicotiana attenuata]|uniref:Uncharacterized protein n=1 Tax=Nicotiana attenuata TaxID=49451 RepID=A0A1J6JII0_NICAT|nr:PREDICTED: uncharacterized protein LOC109223060 [Nicotiana attenuata]OIT06769.1 hypothetical protein A4A49_05886 [Nicotiana attenuata]